MNSISADLYHGSGKKFDKFSPLHARVKNDYYGGGVGYFTGSKEVAKTYAKSSAKTSKTQTPYIYHTSVKMNNVFDVDHKFSGDKLKHVLPHESEHESFARGAGLLKAGSDRAKALSDLKSGKTELSGHQVFKGLSRGGVFTAKAKEHLESKGYDGLRYNGGDNMNAETKHDVYIPYKHDSIKINKVTQIVKKPNAQPYVE